MKFAGLDVAANRLDLVTINPDTQHARWHSLPGDGRGWDTARAMRQILPAASYWDDVPLLAIERPMGNRANVVWAQALVIGAVLARVPAEVVVQEYRAQDWRRLCGLDRLCTKLEVQHWALTHYPESVEWTEHACDALAICHAAIVANDQGIELPA